jgi:hypothetical protein
MTDFVQAKSALERDHAALFLLLKFPELTPFVSGAVPEYSTADADEYLESAWWCKPMETYYRDGEEVRRVVPAPPFLDRRQLQEAHQEFTKLSEIGDANVYLGKLVLDWAASSPKDPRVPEALFIAVNANQSYKYGCNGWQNDEELRAQAITILLNHYPQSSWAARLPTSP